MNQKKHCKKAGGFLEEFENFNWRDLNFNEQLEHFTYSENELSPQFSYFSAGQNDQLQAQAFMPHCQYQNNSIVPPNLLGLQNLMMVQQKKDFSQQQIQVTGIQDLNSQQQQIKIVNPFQNPFGSCGQQNLSILQSHQSISSIQNQNLVSSGQLSQTTPSQLLQQHHQDDASACMKECNQSQFNQQPYSPFKQMISQPDLEAGSSSSMCLMKEKSLSKTVSFEQPQNLRDCQILSEPIQVGNISSLNQSLKSHSEHTTSLQEPSHQLSLLPFTMSDEKIADQEAVGSKKRRGRRKIEDDQYYAITNDKIQEWEYILQNSKNLSKKEKKILRNRISAQKSRNKKKEEFGTLNSQIEVLKDRYRQLFEILEENTCGECKENIINCLQSGQTKRQKVSHDHSHAQLPNAGQGKGKGKNFMKMMLGFVAMVGVIAVAADPFGMTQVNANSLSMYEQPKSFLGYEDILQDNIISNNQLQPQIDTQLMTLNLVSTQEQGQTYTLNVSGENTINDIKKSIQIIYGVPASQQKISNALNDLPDSLTIDQIIHANQMNGNNDLSITINSNYIQ